MRMSEKPGLLREIHLWAPGILIVRAPIALLSACKATYLRAVGNFLEQWVTEHTPYAQQFTGTMALSQG